MEVIQLRGKVGCPGILQIKKKKSSEIHTQKTEDYVPFVSK